LITWTLVLVMGVGGFCPCASAATTSNCKPAQAATHPAPQPKKCPCCKHGASEPCSKPCCKKEQPRPTDNGPSGQDDRGRIDLLVLALDSASLSGSALPVAQQVEALEAAVPASLVHPTLQSQHVCLQV
jgi:hypothetical protein